ncbi:MAG TPA: hypothetical protein VN706_13370 [Gemmatimonadaceae bacterium]|nr:hypothetical protein [Gemmatimonadaceae bacterium]
MMKKSNTETAGRRTRPAVTLEADLGTLIERLGPLNNSWRSASASEKVLLLWDIGDALEAAAPGGNDTLLWEVQRRSYITRSLLRYALIVRRGWAKRDDLERLTRGLWSYTVFREALPFLKGDREGIDTATFDRVGAALRQQDSGAAIKYLKGLKREHIGRTQARGLSAERARPLATKFRLAVGRLADIARGSTTEVTSDTAALAAAQWAGGVALTAASAEALSPEPAPPTATVSTPEVREIVEILREVATESRSGQTAFRKLAGAQFLMETSELLNAIRTPGSLAAWRDRHAGESLRAPHVPSLRSN